MSDAESAHHGSLWERRKLAAMRHIQTVALDLFDEDGYRTVTVERVAAKAGVSPSSVYRYFGTKEMLVLYDDLNPQLLDIISGVGGGAATTPAALARMARLAIPTMLDVLITDENESIIKRRMMFVASEPDVAAGMTRQTEEMEIAIRAVLAERTDRSADDLDLGVVAASAAWGFHAAVGHWARSGFAEPLREVMKRALDLIVTGIEAQFAAPPVQLKTTNQTAM